MQLYIAMQFPSRKGCKDFANYMKQCPFYASISLERLSVAVALDLASYTLDQFLYLLTSIVKAL